MKIKFIITLLTALMYNSVNAQTKNDSIKIRKNELQLNVLPFIMGMNASPNNNLPKGHFMYKRYLKNKWYGRFGIAPFAAKDYSNQYSDAYNGTIKIASVNGSKLGIKYNEKTSDTHFQFSLGLERRWGKGHVKQFYGVDASYGNRKYDYKERFGLRDTLYSGSAYSYSEENKSQRLNDSLVSHRTENINTFSLNPFYGVKIDITKRFFVSAQVGLNLELSISQSKSIIDNNVIKYSVGKFNTFGVDHTPINNNISIGFSF